MRLFKMTYFKWRNAFVLFVLRTDGIQIISCWIFWGWDEDDAKIRNERGRGIGRRRLFSSCIRPSVVSVFCRSHYLFDCIGMSLRRRHGLQAPVFLRPHHLLLLLHLHLAVSDATAGLLPFGLSSSFSVYWWRRRLRRGKRRRRRSIRAPLHPTGQPSKRLPNDDEALTSALLMTCARRHTHRGPFVCCFGGEEEVSVEAPDRPTDRKKRQALSSGRRNTSTARRRSQS